MHTVNVAYYNGSGRGGYVPNKIDGINSGSTETRGAVALQVVVLSVSVGASVTSSEVPARDAVRPMAEALEEFDICISLRVRESLRARIILYRRYISLLKSHMY